MDANITNRLVPIVARYRELTDTIFQAPEAIDVAVADAKNAGVFSIPMLEEILSRAKAEANSIMNEDIPLLLAEYGISEAKLTDGTVVSKELFTEVSQAGLDKELLVSWLTSNGYSSSIKDVISFDKGEWKEEIADFLMSNGYSYSRDSSIHSQTLKKVIKDHLAAGGDKPPEEAVKVSMFERGVVKAPKNKPGF